MADQEWFNRVALALIAVVVVGFLAGIGLGGTFFPAPAAASSSSQTATPAVDYVNLTVAFNPATGSDQYFPANFTVPAHTLVVITITNYDNGTNPIPKAVQAVAGTVGGTEQVARSGSAYAQTVTSVAVVAHTFSIPSLPGGPLNALVPPATSLSQPTTVSFGAFFNETGSYTWLCLAPCDPGSMQALGFMSGTITVV